MPGCRRWRATPPNSASTADTAHLELLTHEKEGTLIRNLGEFPRVLKTAASLREPHRVCRYLEDLAGDYHRFYDSCRVLPQGDERPVTCTPRAWRCARPPGRSSPTDSRSSASALRSGCERASSRSAARGRDPPRRRSRPSASPAEMLQLAPNVWPRNAVRGDDGVVSIAGVTGDRARRGVRHPVVRHRRGRLPVPLPRHRRSVRRGRVRAVRREGIPVQRGGSLDRPGGAGARRVQRWRTRRRAARRLPAERIALHGNNKSVDELTAAVKAGVGHVVLDSMTEIERLDAIAGDGRHRPGRAGARDRRRRGAHPRVHLDRARGPEVRAVAGQRSGDGRGAPGVRRPTICVWSGCTVTSDRRSSTSRGSSSPRTA